MTTDATIAPLHWALVCSPTAVTRLVCGEYKYKWQAEECECASWTVRYALHQMRNRNHQTGQKAYVQHPLPSLSSFFP